MRTLRLGLVLAVASLFTAACGSVTMTGGTGGQNGSGGANATGGNKGTGGTKGGTGGAGGAGETCAQLQNEYAAALPQAKSCSPNSGGGACDQQAPSTLGCSCQTSVNNKNTLDQIQSRWDQAGCQAACPAIACIAPRSGVCQAADAGGGTCADVLATP